MGAQVRTLYEGARRARDEMEHEPPCDSRDDCPWKVFCSEREFAHLTKHQHRLREGVGPEKDEGEDHEVEGYKDPEEGEIPGFIFGVTLLEAHEVRH